MCRILNILKNVIDEKVWKLLVCISFIDVVLPVISYLVNDTLTKNGRKIIISVNEINGSNNTSVNQTKILVVVFVVTF